MQRLELCGAAYLSASVGMALPRIIRDYPDLWAARERDKLNFRYPNGESYQAPLSRSKAFQLGRM